MNDEYLNFGDHINSDVDESSDWTSACSHGKDCQAYFRDTEEEVDNSSHHEQQLDAVKATNSKDINTDPSTTGTSNVGNDPSVNHQNIISNYRCKCKANCLSNYNRDTLSLQKLFYTSLSKDELDLVVLGKVSTSINTSVTLGKEHKHKEKARERTRCHFNHEGMLLFF